VACATYNRRLIYSVRTIARVQKQKEKKKSIKEGKCKASARRTNRNAMARNQSAASDDAYPRRDAGHQRRGYRGRGRARGRYSKGGDYNSRQRPPYRSNNYEHPDNKKSRQVVNQERDDYHDEAGSQPTPEGQHLDASGDTTMEDDLYDDQPVHEEAGSSDIRSLEQRISMPQERSIEQYGDNVAPAEPLDGQNLAVRRVSLLPRRTSLDLTRTLG
jgi:hypothetical protein